MYESKPKSRSSTRKSLHRVTPRPSKPSQNSRPWIQKTSPEKASKEAEAPEPEKSGPRFSTTTPDSLPDFLIWVKNEPFDFGILTPFPCHKIGINLLRKVAKYCHDKPGHFPELSLSQWTHICKYKLQWSNQELFIAYFRVFDILTRPCSAWVQRKRGSSQKKSKSILKYAEILEEVESLDEKFYRSVRQGVDYDTKFDFKVDTLQFLIFLYVQQFRRLHKKLLIRPSSLKQENESWPKLWKNESNASIKRETLSGPNSAVIVPETQHAEFLASVLEDIIDFLYIFNAKLLSSSEDKHQLFCESEGEQDQDTMSIHIMKALGFLLGAASTLQDKEFRTLDSCLSLPEVAGQLEYSRMGKTVSKRSFIMWIHRHLKINPWGPSYISIPKVTLQAMTGVYDRDADRAKNNRIFWNTHHFPKAWLLISGIEKQVLHLENLEPMCSLKIHRCNDAHVYLPGTHHIVLIQKCHGLILNVGVVTKLIKISDCTDLTLTAAGRLVLIHDVRSCSFYLLTPSSPIISGNKNRDISLGPYNTTYPTLEYEMRAAGISPRFQQFGNPIEIASDGLPVEGHREQQSNVEVLSPEKFSTTVFPFKLTTESASARTPPMSTLIPGPYFRRAENSAEKVEEAKKEFKEKLLASEEDTNFIYQITLQRFKKWLKESGNFDQVVGLCSLQKSLQHKSSSPLVCSKGHDLNCVPKSVKSFFCGAADGLNLFSEKGKRNQSRKSVSLNTSETKYFGTAQDRTITDTFHSVDPLQENDLPSRLSKISLQGESGLVE